MSKHSALLWTVKKWFGEFRNGYINLEDQPRSGGPSGIDESIEVIAEELKSDTSTAFHRFKEPGNVSRLDWKE